MQDVIIVIGVCRLCLIQIEASVDSMYEESDGTDWITMCNIMRMKVSAEMTLNRFLGWHTS